MTANARIMLIYITWWSIKHSELIASLFCDRHIWTNIFHLWHSDETITMWSYGKHILKGFWMLSVWWGYVSDRPNQGTRLALTLFVNGLFPRIILIRASQDLRCSSARWLLQCWWMGIAFRLIAAPCFDNLPQLTGERAAATSTNWTDYCKMFFPLSKAQGGGSARLLRGLHHKTWWVTFFQTCHV